MTQPPRRQIDRLKIEALEKGLTREEVRQFGALTRRETWEKAIAFRDATTQDFAAWTEIELVDNDIHSTDRPHTPSFFSYVNFPQLIALVLVAVGFFVLALPILRRIPSPLPIKIQIQIGAKNNGSNAETFGRWQSSCYSVRRWLGS